MNDYSLLQGLGPSTNSSVKSVFLSLIKTITKLPTFIILHLRSETVAVHTRINMVLVVVDLGLTTLLTSQVISIAFYSEREKSDKFFSEALISA